MLPVTIIKIKINKNCGVTASGTLSIIVEVVGIKVALSLPINLFPQRNVLQTFIIIHISDEGFYVEFEKTNNTAFDFLLSNCP